MHFPPLRLKPVAIFLLISALIGGLWTFFRPKPTLADLAERMAVQTLAGDDSTFMATLPKRELDALHWSKNDARRFFREYLKPRYLRFRFVATERKWTAQMGGSGACDFRVSLPDGREVPRLVVVNYSDEGPMRPIMNAVQEVWELQMLHESKTVPKDLVLRSFWRNVTKEAPELRRLGYTQFVPAEPDQPTRSLDEILERASLAKSQRTSPPKTQS